MSGLPTIIIAFPFFCNSTKMSKHQRKIASLEPHKKNQPNPGKNGVQVQLRALDKYYVPKDYIWKDAVIHEKRLKKSWDREWGEMIASQQNKMNLLADGLRRKREVMKNSCLTPYIAVAGSYLNDVETKDFQHEQGLGLDSQSRHKVNFNNLYRTSGPVSKVRFVPEQYGHYRKLKYLHGGSNKATEEPKVEILSQIKHIVDPLLC